MPLLTLQYKYGSDIANMSCTLIMLNGHIDPTYLSISTTIQTTATATSHNIVKEAPAKYALQMPHMSFTPCKHETNVSVYIPHMNSMQSII